MAVDIAAALGEKEPAMGAPVEDETDEALQTHLAAYNRAMKSGDGAGMAAAFKAAVAACSGYDEPDME